MNKRVVITGMGIVSALGCDPQENFRRLCYGQNAMGPLESLDMGDQLGYGFEVNNFDAKDILGKKGLRYLNKGTLYLASAAQLAVNSTDFADDCWAEDAGVIMGSSFGNFPQTTDYTKKIYLEGPTNLLPMESYDVALNSSANYVSVRFSLKGIARTISAGFTSSLDAISDAYRSIRRGDARVILCGGVEQISIDHYRILSLTYPFCPDSENNIRPYGEERCGFLPGEGSVVFVLEEFEHAVSRNADIHAEIIGWGSLYYGANKQAATCVDSIREALADSNREPETIDWVIGSGNGLPDMDRIEAEAIGTVFGKEEISVSSVKRFYGEGYGISGGFSVATAVMGLKNKKIPGTGPIRPAADCPIRHVLNTVDAPELSSVLVNSIDPHGNSSHLIISKVAA